MSAELTFFNIFTAYLLIGLLYVLLPIMSWVVLAKQRRKEVTLWCFGGVLFGLGALLIGLRPALPALIAYSLAFGLLWYGLALKVDALKLALHHKSDASTHLLSGLFFVAIYEMFRSAWPLPTARFTVGMLVFVVQCSLIAYWTLAFYKREKLQSLLWLFFTFFAAATLNTVKLLFVVLGYTEPDVASGQIDGVLTILSGLLLAVVGNFAFVGVYLERGVKEQASILSRQVAQLERQHSIGMMATSFAHELSQPLTSISLDLENIRSQNNAEGIRKEGLNIAIDDIEKALTHSRNLIARIRNYIQPQSTNPQSTELVHLLQDVSGIVDFERQKNGVTFHYDGPSEFYVECDKVEISQIVLNVYRNAIEAMQQTPTRVLSVSIQPMGNQVAICFKDTGVGINDSIQPHLGHAFFTTKDHGLGVGLSISKAIAEKHGGSLAIANGANGGAEVTLRLPIRP